jgi:iron complex outermembrane receptor protein
VTGFSRWGQNQIDYVITNSSTLTQFTNIKPNTNYYFAKNIKGVNTSGFEVGFNAQKEIGKKGMLDINTGYIYAYSRMTEGVITKYISNHARHLVTLAANANISWFDIGLSGLYKYRLPEKVVSMPLTSNEYTLLNARIGATILKKRLGLHVNIDNLFNRKYTEVLGAQQPGRWTYFTLSYQF